MFLLCLKLHNRAAILKSEVVRKSSRAQGLGMETRTAANISLPKMMNEWLWFAWTYVACQVQERVNLTGEQERADAHIFRSVSTEFLMRLVKNVSLLFS